MREKLMYILSAAGVSIVIWSLYKIFFLLPNQANVGAYQIVYFHVPSAITAITGFFVALVMSSLYLSTGDLKYDALAAGITEVALAFASVVLATGMIWARYA